MKAFENNLDVFESVFKRSVKHHFDYRKYELKKMLVISDAAQRPRLEAFAKKFCNDSPVFEYDPRFAWNSLKTEITRERPDVILIQRQLGIAHHDLKFSIGPILESITQEVNIPVLVLPVQSEDFEIRTIGIGFDHQIDNSNLVNKGLLLKKQATDLELIHVEEESIFNYYLDAIGKIPGINTEYAASNIKETILNLSGDFFADVKSKLKDEKLQVSVHCSLGETVSEYTALVRNCHIDLLVFEAEDDSKLAMHSLGQSLTVQFHDKAILLV